MKLFTLTVLMVFLASCAGPHKSASFSISEVQDDCETSTIGDKLFGLGLEFAVFAISGLHGTVEFQSSVKSQSEIEGLVRQEDCELAARREAERRDQQKKFLEKEAQKQALEKEAREAVLAIGKGEK